MSESKNTCTAGEAAGNEVTDFTEQEVQDCVAVQWIGGLLDFIELFWYENAEFSESPPRDGKLKDILGYIPVEIALVFSWFGEQLMEWEKSVSKELISDARSVVILASSVIMICLRFIHVCKEVAEDQQSCTAVSPTTSVSQTSSQHKKGQGIKESNITDFEWRTYQFLPCNENTCPQYLTYESVQNILENLESRCKDQEKFIMEKMFGEKAPNSNEVATTTLQQSPSGKSQEMSASSEDSLLVSGNGDEIFAKLIKTYVSIFSNTETSQRSTLSEKKRRLKRLAYAEAKREPSDSKESSTLVIESTVVKDGVTSCETNVAENVEHSSESSGTPDHSICEDAEKFKVRVFRVYELDSGDHVLISVPADHPLKWGNEAKAPPELLLFIGMQNCAVETWEMIMEADMSNTSVKSDSNKACVKGVFNSLYRNLQVLKAGLVIKKSSQDIKIPLFLHGLSLKTRNRTDTDCSESEASDEDSNRTCPRNLLSHKYGIRKGNMSIFKGFSTTVKKEGDCAQLIIKVPVSSDTSTTASEAGSEEESEHKSPQKQS